MTKIFVDFETRSTVDIKKCGAWKYGLSPTTEIMCLAFSVDGATVEVIPEKDLRGHPLAKKLPAMLAAGAQLVAHNSAFEYVIWAAILSPKYGWPKALDPRNWKCTLAKAAAANLPISLNDCGAALGIHKQKDWEGRAAMLKLTRPIAFDAFGDPIYREDPALYKTLYEYCARDVEAEMEIDARLPDLSDEERKIWELDLVINRRGIAADVPAARKAMALTASLTADLNAKLLEMTGGKVEKATRVAALKKYLEGQGVKGVESLDKAAVNALLARKDVPQKVKEVITVRQRAGKSSTAKYESIVNVASPKDSRCRGLLQYHAAGTGRWGGRLVQPQNFPKGTGYESEEVVENVSTLAPAAFSAKYGDKALEALSAGLRGCLMAGEGKTLVAADYSAIEARVLMWLAGDADALDKYRKGVNLYVDMARFIYKNPSIDKKSHPREYAVGKAAVLGCFTAETEVLTDLGWKRIIDISSDDMVWDGIEWVRHGGVKCQGIKDIIRFAGIGVTPEHLFLRREKDWICASQVAEEDIESLKLMTGMAVCGLLGISSGLAGVLPGFVLNALAAARVYRTRIISGLGKLQDAIVARSARQSAPVKNIGAMLASCLTIGTERGCLTEFQPSSNDVITLTVPASSITAGEEYASTRLGGKTESYSFAISSVFTGGTTPPSNSIAPMSTKGTVRGIFGSLLGQLIAAIDGLYEICRPKSFASEPRTAVYDVVNAGGRHRFTIKTMYGPMVVHNCGYGMGKVKFAATCQSQGIDMDEATAEIAVKAYREKFSAVVKMWYAQEKAAVLATQNPGTTHPCGFTAWFMDAKKEFLCCRLPSGRLLRYYRPSVKNIDTPFGEKAELHYCAAGLTGALEEFKTYGGSLVENITQATARDLMASAMLNAEKAGLPVVLTVHDELVCEVEERRRFVELPEIGWAENLSPSKAGVKDIEPHDALIAEMTKLPNWAYGLPVAAEGWTGKRYRK